MSVFHGAFELVRMCASAQTNWLSLAPRNTRNRRVSHTHESCAIPSLAIKSRARTVRITGSIAPDTKAQNRTEPNTDTESDRERESAHGLIRAFDCLHVLVWCCCRGTQRALREKQCSFAVRFPFASATTILFMYSAHSAHSVIINMNCIKTRSHTYARLYCRVVYRLGLHSMGFHSAQSVLYARFPLCARIGVH